MAHTCPDCGSTCYCGGDIDDICFGDSEDADRCTHYKECESNHDDDDNYDDQDFYDDEY